MNVTYPCNHNAEVEDCWFVPELVTTYNVTWGTTVESVDCSVMIFLPEYVLCLQFKKKGLDSFPVEQGT